MLSAEERERRRAAYRKLAEDQGRMGLRHARARDLGSVEWHVCNDGDILCDYEHGYGIYNTEFDPAAPPSGDDWCSTCVRVATELSS
jgi:hypothetical protein